jgi:hypothetical protein
VHGVTDIDCGGHGDININGRAESTGNGDIHGNIQIQGDMEMDADGDIYGEDHAEGHGNNFGAWDIHGTGDREVGGDVPGVVRVMVMVIWLLWC